MSLEKDVTQIKEELFKAAGADDLANRPKPKRIPYWIDFETWVIMGVSNSDAAERATKYIEAGVIPDIASTSPADDTTNVTDNLSNYIRLKVVPGEPDWNGSGELPVVEAQEGEGPVFKAASQEELSNRPVTKPKIDKDRFAWFNELQSVITKYKEDSEDPLDGDEVDNLVNILKSKINYMEGNITEDEYLNRAPLEY